MDLQHWQLMNCYDSEIFWLFQFVFSFAVIWFHCNFESLLLCYLSPPVDSIWAMMSVWRIRGKISELFCAVLCTAVVHSDIHIHMSRSFECWFRFSFCVFVTGSIARSANLPVFSLLRGQFWGFSPRRGDTLHRWGWKVPSSVPNFTPIGVTTRV